MSVLMNKWMLFHPKAVVMMAQYFYFLTRQWDLVKGRLTLHEGFSDQKPPLDVVLLICTSKTNTFSFVIQPHLLLVQRKKETRHITVYIPFRCLGDPYNCKDMKGVTGKRIAFVLFHHICFISTSQHMYVMSPLTVPGNNWMLQAEELHTGRDPT